MTDAQFLNAIGEMANEIYKAAHALEDLEHSGDITGNGHHLRQRVAQFAIDLAKKRRKVTQ